ncbi:MAG: multiple sugar transport system ATP-binding protein [Solirubrobacteraceae bacterium]|nr:multiple sugar transport system ATP-binding protein [Solirubrobacteraceae bacterium]
MDNSAERDASGVAAPQETGRVELRGVTKTYPNGFEAVKGVSLELEPGELMVFLGPSGCGKTTTLRMIAGLEDVTGGEILLDGRAIQDTPPESRNVSMVFQDHALYPNMTVRANIAFPLKARRRKPRPSKQEIDARVDERAQMLGIEDLLDRRVSQLSGGQRQRVALARALVRDPIAFLMDEAFASLDAVLRREFWTEFKRFQRRIGRLMIHVTHDQEEAMMMADRIAVFSQGEIVQVGVPDEIFERPASRYVAKFVGSPPMNILELTTAGEDGRMTAQGAGATVPVDGADGLQPGREIGLGVRPQRIRWGRARGADEVELPARVTLVESVGTHKVLLCDLGDADQGGTREVRVIIHDDTVPAEGESGHISFRLAHALLIEGPEPEARARPWPVHQTAAA